LQRRHLEPKGCVYIGKEEDNEGVLKRQFIMNLSKIIGTASFRTPNLIFNVPSEYSNTIFFKAISGLKYLTGNKSISFIPFSKKFSISLSVGFVRIIDVFI
jgi:hypothetical protein